MKKSTWIVTSTLAAIGVAGTTAAIAMADGATPAPTQSPIVVETPGATSPVTTPPTTQDQQDQQTQQATPSATPSDGATWTDTGVTNVTGNAHALAVGKSEIQHHEGELSGT